MMGEPEEVDADHGHGVVGDQLEGPQDRAVAAQADDQRAVARQLALLHRDDGVRQQVARLAQPAHLAPVALGPAQDAADHLAAVAPRVDHDADRLADHGSSRWTVSGEKAGRQTATYSAPSGVE